MNISGILSLPNLSSPAVAGQGPNKPGLGALGDSSQSFGGMFKNAIDSIDHQQIASDQEIARAVSGDSTDIHRTMAALQAADLNFQFGLAVRNKMIDAYQQVMQMQV